MTDQMINELIAASTAVNTSKRSFCTWVFQERNYETNLLKNIVRKHFDAPEDVFTTRSRKLELVIVRGVFVYLARAFNLASCKRLGQIMGRDHTTIINAEKQAEVFFASFPEVNKKADEIAAEFIIKTNCIK